MRTPTIPALLLCSHLLLSSCQRQPPPVFTLSHTIPAGSSIELYAQTADQHWKRIHTLRRIPQPLTTTEAEKWTISAAQQRLGSQWKDYCYRVIPPSGQPIIVWQRAGKQVLNPRP
jgi:hypothetical protein